jgi:hypothetical protein
MRFLGRLWLVGLGAAGTAAILARDMLAASMGLPDQTGPYILTFTGITLIALAIAPRFLFRGR